MSHRSPPPQKLARVLCSLLLLLEVVMQPRLAFGYPTHPGRWTKGAVGVGKMDLGGTAVNLNLVPGLVDLSQPGGVVEPRRR